ncbi:hypothetical protein INR49_003694 [Caranx melampygus]|nr:hypothetical protein INR49_003694 [Caranx melampygus]
MQLNRRVSTRTKPGAPEQSSMFPELRTDIKRPRGAAAPGGLTLGAAERHALPRRRSSFLGQPSSERPAAASCGRIGSAGTAATEASSWAPRPGGRGLQPGDARLPTALASAACSCREWEQCGTGPAPARRPGGGSRSSGRTEQLPRNTETMRALEQLNQQLEEQIRLCLDRKASSAGLGAAPEEWEDVYRQVSEAILDNARLMLQTENVQANAEDFKDRYENEQPFRKAVEEEISSLYKVIDDANLTRAELEEQWRT